MLGPKKYTFLENPDDYISDMCEVNANTFFSHIWPTWNLVWLTAPVAAPAMDTALTREPIVIVFCCMYDESAAE